MGATFCFAALCLLSQTPDKTTLEDKIQKLDSDLRQTLTLFDSLRDKVQNASEGQKLLGQLDEKLVSISSTALKYQAQAKTDDQRANIALVRFESLANANQTPQQIETLATEIATKYRESSVLSPALENLVFYKYLTPERYTPFETILKQSKNPEVLASTSLANLFISFINDTGDLNKFKSLGDQYPKTKAGQRASKIFDFRIKLSLGNPMPELDLELVTGFKFKVSSLRTKVVVLDFWGFWNQPSVAQFTEIKDYVSKYSSKLAWVGINTDNWTKPFIMQRIKDSGITWQNVMAGSITGPLPMDMGIINYPSKIIIDAMGVVRYVPSSRDWRQPLEEALAKA